MTSQTAGPLPPQSQAPQAFAFEVGLWTIGAAAQIAFPAGRTLVITYVQGLINTDPGVAPEISLVADLQSGYVLDFRLLAVPADPTSQLSTCTAWWVGGALGIVTDKDARLSAIVGSGDILVSGYLM